MSRRPTLWVPTGGLVLAALALWGSSRVAWQTVRVTGGPHGAVLRTETGAQLEPALGPIALLALASVAAAVATAGLLRRVLGGLLTVGGAGLVWWGVATLLDVAAEAGISGYVGRALVVVAGLLVAVAGIGLGYWGHRMGGLGSRHRTLGGREPSPRRPRDLWDALDAGIDPTNDATDSRRSDPGPWATGERG